VLVALGALLVGLAALLAVLLAATPASAAPFACEESTVFVSQNQDTQLYRLVYGAGSTTFEAVGPAAGLQYNALSFNQDDGYLYAIGLSTSVRGHLLQIDSAGGVTDLGLVSGLPTGASGSNSLVTGAFDADGDLYLAENRITNVIYRVDLGTQTATSITLSQSVRLADWAFVGGVLWGVEVPDSTDLVRIDPSTGAVTRFANDVVPADNPGYGAAWTYGNGHLGLSSNGTGQVYEVAITDPTGATPTFELVSTVTGPSSAQNDGASCVADELVDLSVEKTGPAVVAPGGAITWTVVVTNEGPGTSSGHSVTDIVAGGITDLDSPDEACAPVAADTVQCVSGALEPGQSVTYTITGTAPDQPGIVENDATVVGLEEDPDGEDDTDGHETSVEEAAIPLVAPWPAAVFASLAFAGFVLVRHRRRAADIA
jgi:uncharacterized repeat protein (TIGR01451 family)